MVSQDSEHEDQLGSLGAQHTVEDAWRSLSARLMISRIKREDIHIRPVGIGRIIEETLVAESGGYALHIVLRKKRRFRTPSMRPSSLWLIVAYDNRILVLASGMNAWEFKRMELAQALEKMKEVLAMV